MASRRVKVNAQIHEFRVAIRGLELDDQTIAKISNAIQGAALFAMRDLDFKGDFAARTGDGGTQGIELIALTDAQSRLLGFGSE